MKEKLNWQSIELKIGRLVLKINAIFLLSLFFLATRLYATASNPPALYWDEASIGYNAYSILKTGHDEWGTYFPLHFRAFGEFKLPVFIYTVTFFETILGPTELAVRLPAVFYSFGSLLIVYLITKQLSQNETTALFSAVFFTTCPWFFIFSRTGYEVTAGLFFYLLGIHLFLKDKKKYFLISVLSFLLTMYSYNSFRIITPLTLLSLLVYQFWNQKNVFRSKWKFWFVGLLIFGLGILPIIRFSLSGGNTRFEQVSIFNQSQPILNFLDNYLSHFSLQFLLINGDNNVRSQIPGFGQLNFVQFLLIFLGLYWVIKSKSKIGFLLIVLLLLAPIPAALTKESPHALRSLSITPFLAILAAVGLEQISTKVEKWIQPAVMLLVLIFFGFYFYSFLNDYPQKSANDWQYPYKVINTQNKAEMAQAKEVYISPKLGQPYIFTLFYQQYDPDQFLKDVEYNSPDQWGRSTVKKIGKIHFEETNGQINYLLIR